jgi:hypothetical protein
MNALRDKEQLLAFVSKAPSSEPHHAPACRHAARILPGINAVGEGCTRLWRRLWQYQHRLIHETVWI